jgi:hypothetical protein
MDIPYTKYPYNIPNGRRIHQNYLFRGPTKQDFWYENVPSGNPGAFSWSKPEQLNNWFLIKSQFFPPKIGQESQKSVIITSTPGSLCFKRRQFLTGRRQLRGEKILLLFVFGKLFFIKNKRDILAFITARLIVGLPKRSGREKARKGRKQKWASQKHFRV